MDSAGSSGRFDVGSLLEPETRAAFLRLGRPQDHPAGHCLMLQGAPATSMVLVERGLAEVTVSDAAGRSSFVTFRGPGNLLGEFAVLDGGLRCATVETRTPVRLRVYGQLALTGFLTRHPDAAAALTSVVLAKTRAALDRQFRYAVGAPEERIARVVLDHADEFGRPAPATGSGAGPGTIVDVPLTHARIADLVHLSTSKVAKNLLGWSRDGLLVTGYRGPRRLRLLDRAGLEQFAGVS